MEEPDDQMLRSMCQFFASGTEQKLAFLPEEKSSINYIHNECGDRTHKPLVYYCSAAFELMDRYRGGRQNEFSSLIADISAMLSVMFELGRKYPFIWELDKEICILSGEVDRFWSVLQRLAIQALATRGWPQAPPEIPFRETGWSGTRQFSVGGPEEEPKTV